MSHVREATATTSKLNQVSLVTRDKKNGRARMLGIWWIPFPTKRGRFIITSACVPRKTVWIPPTEIGVFLEEGLGNEPFEDAS